MSLTSDVCLTSPKDIIRAETTTSECDIGRKYPTQQGLSCNEQAEHGGNEELLEMTGSSSNGSRRRLHGTTTEEQLSVEERLVIAADLTGLTDNDINGRNVLDTADILVDCARLYAVFSVQVETDELAKQHVNGLCFTNDTDTRLHVAEVIRGLLHHSDVFPKAMLSTGWQQTADAVLSVIFTALVILTETEPPLAPLVKPTVDFSKLQRDDDLVTAVLITACALTEEVDTVLLVYAVTLLPTMAELRTVTSEPLLNTDDCVIAAQHTADLTVGFTALSLNSVILPATVTELVAVFNIPAHAADDPKTAVLDID